MTLPLTFGLSDCDRLRPLVDGTVKIEGVAPEWNIHPVQDLFNIQCSRHVYDACEFPLATYLRDLEGPRRYLALPYFPSRHFRLSCIFVNADAGIETPADLAGKRIGLQVWDMAAAVWLRGILEEHFGLPMRSPVYVTNGMEEARQGDEHPQVYPDGFTIEHADDEGGLARMLAEGRIDAIYTARAPSTFGTDSRVVRLFKDPKSAELELFRKTGIFPPMHVFCVKREIAEANPGLTRNLFDALVASQAEARDRIYDSAMLSVMLPWLLEHLLDTEAELGADYWAAGFEKNRDTLATIIRYMRAEGLLQSDVAPEDMFDDAMVAT